MIAMLADWKDGTSLHGDVDERAQQAIVNEVNEAGGVRVPFTGGGPGASFTGGGVASRTGLFKFGIPLGAGATVGLVLFLLIRRFAPRGAVPVAVAGALAVGGGLMTMSFVSKRQAMGAGA